MSITYKDSGVDIEAADNLIERIKPLAAATRTPEVVDDVGGFAGLAKIPTDIKDPILVSGTDGVGTKLKLAFALKKHDTIGVDLVAMCVNDIITTGARPLYFLDYFATGQLSVDVAEQVIKGIAEGCQQAGCALIGGETAELPGMYQKEEYDLAGFAVGVVSAQKILGQKRVAHGDSIIAIGSSGIHSNGYSLAQKVLFNQAGLSYEQKLPELSADLGTVLLTPTRIYAKTVQQLSAALDSELHALCHITGGGIVGNLPRILPRGASAKLKLGYERPAIFDAIQRLGPVDEAEMLKTFNLGVGMVAIVSKEAEGAALASLTQAGERAWHLGRIELDSADTSPPSIVIE